MVNRTDGMQWDGHQVGMRDFVFCGAPASAVFYLRENLYHPRELVSPVLDNGD